MWVWISALLFAVSHSPSLSKRFVMLWVSVSWFLQLDEAFSELLRVVVGIKCCPVHGIWDMNGHIPCTELNEWQLLVISWWLYKFWKVCCERGGRIYQKAGRQEALLGAEVDRSTSQALRGQLVNPRSHLLASWFLRLPSQSFIPCVPAQLAENSWGSHKVSFLYLLQMRVSCHFHHKIHASWV